MSYICFKILTRVRFLSFSCPQRGLTSPRAYVHYNSAADPDPKYFEQILKNSLPEEQIKQFCADFLALFRQKEHKRPVPCAIGAADSGKTSLFSPVFQIVPLSRIARVTKQKSFNKSMIDSQTEVIFLDEAHRDLLDVDDWKIICQGGFTSHDVKWKKAEGFHCRAGMYITCQKEIDFGDAHNDAMNRRLHKYHFKSLPHVEPEANKWLREHAMDCIVWAQRLTVADSSGTLTTHISEGGGLAGEDVERILSVSITEEHLPSSSQPDCTEEESETDHVSPQNEGSTTYDSSDEGDLMKLRREIETAEPDGIRQRQLSMLLKNAEARQKAQKRFQKTRRDHRLAGRRRLLVNLGVVGESQADRLITDPDCPLPPTLEQKHQQAIKDRNERLEAQKQREDREKVRRAFSNPWLENMEKEMAECNWRFERTKDAEMRAVLKSLMEIDSDKLRAFHQGQSSLGLQLAVEERKKLCLQHGWVEPACANLVRDVYSPLPMIVDLSNFNDCNSDRPVLAPPDTKDDTDDDDDALFITPKTPSYVPPNDVPQPMLSPPTSQESVEYDDREMVLTPKTPSYVPSTDGSSASVCPSPLLRLPSPCRPSKRRRLSRSQLPKGQKRVTRFFCSQQRPNE